MAISDLALYKALGAEERCLIQAWIPLALVISIHPVSIFSNLAFTLSSMSSST